MQGTTTESVGGQFQEDLLQSARDKTLEVILEASKRVVPGMAESEAKTLIQEIQTRMGAPKSWHPPQIRFGENSILPFGQNGQENVLLKENDIFFFDIGPIFEGHEGDVGRPFAVGADSEMARCCRDSEEIWHRVREHWRSTSSSGAKLYEFAKSCAAARGWKPSGPDRTVETFLSCC